VLKGALDQDGEDLHVPVRVGGEAASRGDPILIDHAEAAKPHVRWIVIVREGKRELGFEPAMVCLAAGMGFPDSDFHIWDF
jgi:hypothetical protein